MPRYKMLIEYDGTDFCGWQKQPNAVTIEGEIEAALARILQQPVDVIGQGRTDSGVHAEAQVAHLDLPEDIGTDRLLYALLGVLPDGIGVWNLEKTDADFHARFDALSRSYRYQLALRPKPLQRAASVMVLQELDLEAMKVCAKKVQGTHNFDSFTKPDNQNPDSSCEVTRSEFTTSDSMLTYHIKANRFVRHMVRRLLGTMLQVGKGKIGVGKFMDLIESPSKEKDAFGASAKGLILEKVSYKKD